MDSSLSNCDLPEGLFSVTVEEIVLVTDVVATLVGVVGAVQEVLVTSLASCLLATHTLPVMYAANLLAGCKAPIWPSSSLACGYSFPLTYT